MISVILKLNLIKYLRNRRVVNIANGSESYLCVLKKLYICPSLIDFENWSYQNLSIVANQNTLRVDKSNY